jgi:hypothetical protein
VHRQQPKVCTCELSGGAKRYRVCRPEILALFFLPLCVSEKFGTDVKFIYYLRYRWGTPYPSG